MFLLWLNSKAGGNWISAKTSTLGKRGEAVCDVELIWNAWRYGNRGINLRKSTVSENDGSDAK